MALLDLFALAASNDAALAAELDTKRRMLSADLAARMGSFCEAIIQRGHISINMKPWKMRDLLRRGRYPRIYEIAEENAAAAGHSTEDELRAMQGGHYERRVRFDRSFENGERFLYGALNIGGNGTNYGVFCIVLADDATDARSTAYLPENSLDRYVQPAAVLTFDQARLRREVATPMQRHCVAALKHADDLAACEPPAWDTMLCSGGTFVEAIFVADVTLPEIGEIRLKQDDMQRLSRLAIDAVLGKLSATDRCELEDFQDCMKTLRARGLDARVKEV